MLKKCQATVLSAFTAFGLISTAHAVDFSITDEAFVTDGVSYVHRTVHPHVPINMVGVPVERPLTFVLRVTGESQYAYILGEQNEEVHRFNKAFCDSSYGTPSQKEFKVGGPTVLPLACDYTREAAERYQKERLAGQPE